jgi:glutathione synthase/RimK-type ligase-like ATP-grasp enzyme
MSMTLTLAIQPDEVNHRNGEKQSFSARWIELAESAGHAVRIVDVHRPDIVDQLAGADAFMWRPPLSVLNREFSRRLLPALELAGLPVFPSRRTLWHSEDKIAQSYLLKAIGVPVADTWVFWRLEPALAFLAHAAYPLVMKLSAGFQSNAVQLLRDADEAAYWARRMFTTGATGFDKAPAWKRRWREAVRGVKLAVGRPLHPSLEYGNLYVQQFLPGNDHDTRVTVIGKRAFAFRRRNRPNDFRASGSGRIDWDPAAIDLRHVRLALRVARALGTQSLGVDLLYRDGEPVVCETTYTFASWAVRDCPGHWALNGDPEHGELTWVDGRLRPEDAIFADFVGALSAGDRQARAA